MNLFEVNTIAANGSPAWPFIDQNTDQFLESKVSEILSPSRLQLSRLALQTKTTDQIEHAFPLIKAPIPTGWFTNDWIELARIPSLYGKITTLRKINTFIGSANGTAIDDQTNQTFVDQFCQFYLVYTQIRSGARRVFNQVYPGFGELPGNVLFRLPNWNDSRYAYARSGSEVTFPLVPGYNLSLFAKVLPITDLPGDWDPQGLYAQGALVYDPVGLIIYLAKNGSIGAPPATNPNLWQPLADIPSGFFFYSFAGRLIASVQDERELSSAWQARSTFII